MRSMLVRVAAVFGVGSLLLGVVVGWLWSRMAPSVRYQVFPNQSWAPLPTETQHLFVGFAMFTLLGLITGLVLASVGWSFAPVRGAAMLVVVGVAAAVSALVGGWLGQLWMSGTDPATVAGIAGVQTVVDASAVVTGWPAYLAAPTAAVVAYVVFVAWNGLPDLGRSPQVDGAESPALRVIQRSPAAVPSTEPGTPPTEPGMPVVQAPMIRAEVVQSRRMTLDDSRIPGSLDSICAGQPARGDKRLSSATRVH